MRYVCLGFALLLWGIAANAQAPKDYTLPVQTRIQTQPPGIQFNWPAIPTATSYFLARKRLEDTLFTLIDSIKTNAGLASQFIDASIQPGIPYEYHLRGVLSSPAPTSRNIFLVTGIDVAPVHQAGTVLLLIDSAMIDSLRPEIQAMHYHLVEEGWRVRYAYANRSNDPTHAPWVKEKIRQQYLLDSTLSTVFIVGHIAVPYSGRINPDGHPEHLGAWPADGYYADLDSLWKDDTVQVTTAARAANINIPGDGKFDESNFYFNRLAVGRLDLSELPLMGASEATLYKRYFQKNQAFRRSAITIPRRALIHDNLLVFAEKFSQGAWKSYSTLVGLDSITDALPYAALTTDTNGYLFSYGASTGGYTQATNVVSSANFASQTYRSVFTQLMGSYFGDWDTPNNLMRCGLASNGYLLSCHWGGRPQHFFHHLAVGKSIGYSTQVTMNNKGSYFPHGFSLSRVHQALMGDPTLTYRYLMPQSKPSLQPLPGGTVQLHWPRASDTAIHQYFVYRAPTVTEPFVLLTNLAVSDTSFLDNQPLSGKNVYMIRGVKLDTILAGTATLNQGRVHWLSPGGIDSVLITNNPIPVRLIDLQATAATSCRIQLAWRTAEESQIRYYEPQWSTNGQQFAPWPNQASTPARNGYQNEYRRLLPTPASGTIFYRIMWVDWSGQSRYSPTQQIQLPSNCSALPKCWIQDRHLYVWNNGNSPMSVQLFNSAGQRMLQVEASSGLTSYLLAQLPAGIYVVKTQQSEQIQHTRVRIL